MQSDSPIPGNPWSHDMVVSVDDQPNNSSPEFETQPERVCLDALIPAWESGLSSLVSLPYSGYYERRISSTHLVVSNATRARPDAYRRALAEPVE